jgi:ATP-dependent phosphoenolpyruvate carboxykinase
MLAEKMQQHGTHAWLVNTGKHCHSTPFIKPLIFPSWHSMRYASMLAEKMKQHGTHAQWSTQWSTQVVVAITSYYYNSGNN